MCRPGRLALPFHVNDWPTLRKRATSRLPRTRRPAADWKTSTLTGLGAGRAKRSRTLWPPADADAETEANPLAAAHARACRRATAAAVTVGQLAPGEQ